MSELMIKNLLKTIADITGEVDGALILEVTDVELKEDLVKI